MGWLDAQVTRVLAHGSPRVAVTLVVVATMVSTAAALRQAMLVPFDEFAYGEGRSAWVDALLDSLGRDRTAVVVYLLERSWQPILAVAALAPLLLWLLGTTAVHAAARMRGASGALHPVLVLFGYAAAAARLPVDLAGLALPAFAGPVGTVTTLGLGLVAWLALRRNYGLSGRRALTTLLIAVVLYYVLPLLLIAASVIAILVAAIVLDYVR